MGVQEDYSETHAARRGLERLAYHDGLTGLGNRRAFDVQLTRLLSEGQPFVLQSLDLNNFKQVNDQYGHPAGDALLQQVAACLKQASQSGGTAFRVGGDEFGLLLPGCDLATGLLDDLVIVDGERICGSTGTACFPEEAEDVERLLRLADRRLYGQKELTRQRQRRRTRPLAVQPDPHGAPGDACASDRQGLGLFWTAFGGGKANCKDLKDRTSYFY